MRRLFNRIKSESGTSSIETAIVFPFLMLACLVILQFGTLVYARQSAEEAARYGVRRGVVSVGNPAGAAVAAADAYAVSALPWGHTTQVEAPGGVVGSTMRLRVSTRPPNIIGPLMAFFGGGVDGLVVQAIAEGRMEGWE